MSRKVSVIIPFYNNVQWLEEAIESVLKQTYKNIEIVVVNDGSSDDVNGFLKKYGALINYRYQENAGAASARNHAMNIARGRYFAFLDSDDIWLPDKLEKQIKFMERIGAKWSHTNYYYWNPGSDKLRNVFVYDEYGDIFKKTFVSIKMATPTVVLDSEVLVRHPDLRFPESYRTGQDTRFWRDISRLYPIALLREPLVKVRLRKDNTFKRNVMQIQFRGKEFDNIKNNPDAPFVAKLRSFIYWTYSKMFKLPSSTRKDFIARFFLIFPYFIGRGYVKYLSIVNKRFRNFVC